MTQEKNKVPKNNKENSAVKTDQWIDKAEAFIDNAAEKVHKSDTYKTAGKTAEKATKAIFRKAGKWWGKYSKE